MRKWRASNGPPHCIREPYGIDARRATHARSSAEWTPGAGLAKRSSPRARRRDVSTSVLPYAEDIPFLKRMEIAGSKRKCIGHFRKHGVEPLGVFEALSGAAIKILCTSKPWFRSTWQLVAYCALGGDRSLDSGSLHHSSMVAFKRGKFIGVGPERFADAPIETEEVDISDRIVADDPILHSKPPVRHAIGGERGLDALTARGM